MVIDLIIKWAVPFVCGVLVAGLIALYKREKALKMGLQALLRDRIYTAYEKYACAGYCPLPAREVIEELYNQYHALGGNGTMTELVKKIHALPTSKAVKPVEEKVDA